MLVCLDTPRSCWPVTHRPVSTPLCTSASIPGMLADVHKGVETGRCVTGQQLRGVSRQTSMACRVEAAVARYRFDLPLGSATRDGADLLRPLFGSLPLTQ